MMPLDPSDPVLRRRLLAASAAAGFALFLILPFVTDAGFASSVVLLSLPLIVLGAVDMASTRSWYRLAASIAVPAAVYPISWEAVGAAALLLFGSAGISAFSDMVCRRVMPSALRDVEHAGSGRRRAVEMFLTGVPPGLDTRDMRMDGSVRREAVPWGLRASAMLATAAPMLLIWIAAASAGMGLGSGAFAVMTLSTYIVALVVPWTVLSTADVRVCAPGLEHRLYDGFVRTVASASVPLLVALIVVCVAADPSASTYWLVIASAAFVVLEALLSLIRFEGSVESELVADMAADWESDHPVLLYSGLDGRSARSGDDGVPGTPRRSEDSCFPERRVRSVNRSWGSAFRRCRGSRRWA